MSSKYQKAILPVISVLLYHTFLFSLEDAAGLKSKWLASKTELPLKLVLGTENLLKV